MYIEPDFNLSTRKIKMKRYTNTDVHGNGLTPTFNEYIEYSNRNKVNKSLKERIAMHFNKK
jgi:hypothetical protein